MAAINKRKLLLLILIRRRQQEPLKPRRTARFWIRDIYKRRKEKGEFHTLVKEAALSDQVYFFKLFRMTPRRLEIPLIKRSSIRRETIEPAERLCVTLRYLITGDAFTTIAASYRVSETSISRIVNKTCKAIWNVLLEKGFVKCPKTKAEWRKIAVEFEKMWNFPNCVGAIDGKHVHIQCPRRSGSLYFNYKKYFSLVLMAVVNAKYQFTLVDGGDYGRLSDGSVFSSSNLGYSIQSEKLELPDPRNLLDTDKLFPYVFVGDDAFPLRKNLVSPTVDFPAKKECRCKLPYIESSSGSRDCIWNCNFALSDQANISSS